MEGTSPDTTPLRFGHQEEVGYNPHKPGRGCHHPLVFVVACNTVGSEYGLERVAAYVTSMPSEMASPAQAVMLYRKRADAGNPFEEIKNLWGYPMPPAAGFGSYSKSFCQPCPGFWWRRRVMPTMPTASASMDSVPGSGMAKLAP